MLKRNLKVVELNKQEEKILLEREESKFLLFFRKHRLLILLTLLILSLTILIFGVVLIIKNLKNIEEPVIKLVDIETNLLDDNVVSINSYLSTDDSGAKNRFELGFSNGNGEVLTIKVVETGKYTIKYYSDGTAIKIMKDGKHVTRIFSLDDGSYGIKENGVIDVNARVVETLVKETKNYGWGTVIYFMDGTADVSSLENNEIINIFIRNVNDINENYISSSKVSYPKEIKNVGSYKVTYYYDGSILIDDGNYSYVVRNSDDINISGSNISYLNNNKGTVISKQTMLDGREVVYYSDGGAIIRNGSRTISVRKSNSIIIKNNEIYEIVDSIYVTKSKENENIIVYTNGGCIVKYKNKTYYVSESGNVKYNEDGSIKNIIGNKEELVSDKIFNNDNVKTFEKIAVVTTSNYIAIVSNDDVIFDTNGKFKEIREEKTDEGSSFVISNNTSEKLNYRIILDKSDSKTNLNSKYIKYQLLVKDQYVMPTFLSDSYWNDDSLLKEVELTGDNYILFDSTIESFEVINVKLMLWTDYETIDNSMQNKYFYGTIRVYAWTTE